jgi:hypothetical protein
MAAGIHAIFSQGQGVPVSSAHAEKVVEMKLWLAAIANGQLKIVDTAQERIKPLGEALPLFDEKEGNGTPPNKD